MKRILFALWLMPTLVFAAHGYLINSFTRYEGAVAITTCTYSDGVQFQIRGAVCPPND